MVMRISIRCGSFGRSHEASAAKMIKVSFPSMFVGSEAGGNGDVFFSYLADIHLGARQECG